ncbi:unnamed protein product [Moneuplotes crassus]|uniref:Uncharacterized protein n=1 Tax=Euplotes crassus TaxID=5936 RepID=A0AAD1X7B8_EUPCR|nr:unnamed protein product [Moneuplotes crassus]
MENAAQFLDQDQYQDHDEIAQYHNNSGYSCEYADHQTPEGSYRADEEFNMSQENTGSYEEAIAYSNRQLDTATINAPQSRQNFESSSFNFENGLLSTEKKKGTYDEDQGANWRNLLTPNKSLFGEKEENSCINTSEKKSIAQNNLSDMKVKMESKTYQIENRYENSIEDLKVSNSDANDNSLLKPQNLDYGDDKENSILNHPNVLRSHQSKSSKQDQNCTDDVDMELSKSQNKSGGSNNNLLTSKGYQISFLGSISKMDDFSAINKLMNKKETSPSSKYSDSKNQKDLESMLRTAINHNQVNDKEEAKDELGIMNQDIINADESLFRSIIKSSNKKQKRKIYRELAKKKDQPGIAAKAKLLMSSYMSAEESPKPFEDDLRLSQTKMDQIIEENEDQENDAFHDFINKEDDHSQNESQDQIPVRHHPSQTSEKDRHENVYLEQFEVSRNIREEQNELENSPQFTPEIYKQDQNDNEVLQNLMKSKENTGTKESEEDENYVLSLPLQQEDGQSSHKYQKSSNYYSSENENSVILNVPNTQAQTRGDVQMRWDNEVAHRDNARQSHNGSRQMENHSSNGKSNDTGMEYSQNNGATTIAGTSIVQTIQRVGYKDSIDVNKLNGKYNDSIEEQKSVLSQDYQENTHQNNIPDPYYDQESVRNSLAMQNQNMMQPKPAQRYNQPQYPHGVQTSISPEDYESINHAFNSHQIENTRNRGHIMKSSEFTFVGRRNHHSPNENLPLRQNQTEMISSTRQSIILNPLTDVNVTSTTKKQNVQKNLNNPSRMANIEEEGTPLHNLDESHNMPQYLETDTFNQQNFNQHKDQQEDDLEFTQENFQILYKEYKDISDFLELFTKENQTLRELLNEAGHSFHSIFENCFQPNFVREEATHALGSIKNFLNEEGVASQIQSFSAVDDEGRRSIMNYESQMDALSQNDNYTQVSLMSPIPRTENSAEFNNFEDFTQNNEFVRNQNSVELPQMHQRVENGKSPANAEYVKSQAEYSYQDQDNMFLHKPKSKRKKQKQKKRRESSSETSSSVRSYPSDNEPNRSFDLDSPVKKEKKKYKKVKKLLNHYKSSLAKYKNMCELQKLKNENLEDKVSNLSKEVENIKRSSVDSLNPTLMYLQKLENMAYATQRNLPEMVSTRRDEGFHSNIRRQGAYYDHICCSTEKGKSPDNCKCISRTSHCKNDCQDLKHTPVSKKIDTKASFESNCIKNNEESKSTNDQPSDKKNLYHGNGSEEKKIKNYMSKFKNMSKYMKELLSLTKNMQIINTAKMSISDKMSAQQIKRQYNEYQHQVAKINDAFNSNLNPEKKFQQAEDALKRSHYLLKKSMEAAKNFKNSNMSKSGKILKDLGISSIAKSSINDQIQPEKEIKDLRSQFEESSLRYSIDTLSRYHESRKN